MRTIDSNPALEVSLIEGPEGVRLVNVSLDREGKTGYWTGVCIKTLPVERLVCMFPDSEELLYEYCGTQEYEH